MEKQNSTVDNIKAYITKLLKMQGLYKPELSYQIELLSSDLMVFRGYAKAVEALDGNYTITEYAQGEERIKMNPLLEAMKRQSEVVRKDLASLYMNRQIKQESVNKKEDKGGEPDPLMELMSNINNI